VQADGRIRAETWRTHWDGIGPGWIEAAVDDDGFFTDPDWVESRRGERSWSEALCRFEGGSSVRLGVDHHGLHDRCYVAVTAPLAWVRERIRHADGAPLGEEDGELGISARCQAKLLPSAYVETDGWRRLPISVRVERGDEVVVEGNLYPGEPERLLHLPEW